MNNWPVIKGSYALGDPKEHIAVCTLTSEELFEPISHFKGIAISGIVYTANLGISRIVQNLTSNPSIRFLAVCGKESPLFKPGQTLLALSMNGTDDEGRVVGAEGYEPVLSTISSEQVARFRKQITVLDWIGTEDLKTLKEKLEGLTMNAAPFDEEESSRTLSSQSEEESFVPIQPGGMREPLQYDPKGYFVISVDKREKMIILRHYLPDHMPAHEMRGRYAQSMLLGLLREGLVTQLSHAGYLGEELAKAQAALFLDLKYNQDRPLQSEGGKETERVEQKKMPSMPAISQPMKIAELEAVPPGGQVDIVVEIKELIPGRSFAGSLLESDEAQPFSAYHRTQKKIGAVYSASAIKFIMGGAPDIVVGALVRIRGKLQEGGSISVEQIAILSRVAKVLEG